MPTESISSVSGVSPTVATASAPTTNGGAKALGYDAFMKLLLAQMQNQDPMDPMKSSDYVAQLATFSQVAQSTEMNDKLSSILSNTLLVQAEGIIGRQVTSADGRLSGTAVQAKIVDNQVIAVLQDGQEIVLGAGVKLGGPAG